MEQARQEHRPNISNRIFTTTARNAFNPAGRLAYLHFGVLAQTTLTAPTARGLVLAWICNVVRP